MVLPLGFSVSLCGAPGRGTTELLSRVADAAHQQGYVCEVWGTFKGGRVRAGDARPFLGVQATP